MSTIRQAPSKAKLKQTVRETVFGDRMFCPHCGDTRVYRSEDRYRCQKCRKPFSLTSVVPWLKHMKISWDTLATLLWGYCQELKVEQAEELAEVSHVTVRRWYGKFRDNLPDRENLLLDGEVQMDEAFYGGNDGCMLVAAKQAGTGKLCGYTLDHTNPARHDVMPLIQRRIKPGALLHTDGAGIYKGIENYWPVTHETDIHSDNQFEKTSEIEGIFGAFKTYVRRMYHHVRTENLGAVFREYCIRLQYPEYFEHPKDLFAQLLPTLSREAIKSVAKSETAFATENNEFILLLSPAELSAVPA